MRLLLGTLFALGVAALVGLGATWLALTQGQAVGGLTVGAWNAWPQHGTRSIDPYARAMVARSGELPIGSGDGIAFRARRDDKGEPLDGRCDVVVSGMTPQARYWTITLYDPNGGLVGNSVQRHGFTSHEVMRRANGAFEITVSPRARPGNWLPSGGAERYTLVLRLYDTPLGVTTRGSEVTMPSITRRACP
ncbi:MAG: DUF1214 domain-containing protein [Rhizobiales bacterium]|nr:DUF1214 domain-containing protein [Hyphomicrobiales bacterium]